MVLRNWQWFQIVSFWKWQWFQIEASWNWQCFQIASLQKWQCANLFPLETNPLIATFRWLQSGTIATFGGLQSGNIATFRGTQSGIIASFSAPCSMRFSEYFDFWSSSPLSKQEEMEVSLNISYTLMGTKTNKKVSPTMEFILRNCVFVFLYYIAWLPFFSFILLCFEWNFPFTN